jgi:hypothetical protein
MWLRSSGMIFTLDAVPHRTRTITERDICRRLRDNPEHTGVSGTSIFEDKVALMGNRGDIFERSMVYKEGAA